MCMCVFPRNAGVCVYSMREGEKVRIQHCFLVHVGPRHEVCLCVCVVCRGSCRNQTYCLLCIEW